MNYNATVSNITTYPNGPLISVRYIVDWYGEPLTAEEVEGITLSVFRQYIRANGELGREPVEDWTDVAIDVNEVIQTTQNSPSGKPYNFKYCIEGAITEPNAVYIVEYIIELLDGHTIPIVIKATTTN